MDNDNDGHVVSKVLVLDNDNHHDEIKAFCAACDLVAIKPHASEVMSVLSILKSNVDLGGIILYEGYTDDSLALAREIHVCRPELPIFFRRDSTDSLSDLERRDATMFRCAFTPQNLEPLRATLETSIFSRIYPNELVRGITQMTLASLGTLFQNCEISVETPYLVKDRIIIGSVYSLITIESHWCRGYMMLQAPSKKLLNIIRRDAGDEGKDLSFRELNNVLGETTNMIWGSFKNRYVRDGDVRNALMQSQVPIIINHDERYISFGSDDPQLCLKYTLQERNSRRKPVEVFQRFIFNLNWSPEDFSENASLESLFDLGELEMF